MKAASNVMSWFGGLLQMAIAWIWAFNLPKEGWLFAIALIYTVAGFLILTARQMNVSEGKNIVAWGVITLLFISVLGGIFTLCIPRSYTSYRPHYSYHTKQSQESAQKNADEIKSIEDYTFVNVSSASEISKGSIVQIIDGFYAGNVGQRVIAGDICEVLEVNGDNLVVQVNHSTSFFRAETKIDNVLLKIKNPNLIEKKELDKFEEIKKYKELLDLNIITQEEFENKKKELL